MKDIKAIKKLLVAKPRDLALFTMGINTNLRAVDLLKITVGQVRNLRPLDGFELKEQKTGKSRRITLNKACIDAIQKLLATGQFQDEEFLFSGQRGVLTVPSVNRLVKECCSVINLQGNFGAHTAENLWIYAKSNIWRGSAGAHGLLQP